MAERVGFEPTVRSRVHLISSQARSATPAPLLGPIFTTGSRKTASYYIISSCRDQRIAAISGVARAGSSQAASNAAALPDCVRSPSKAWSGVTPSPQPLGVDELEADAMLLVPYASQASIVDADAVPMPGVGVHDMTDDGSADASVTDDE